MTNRVFWERTGDAYSKTWQSKAKQSLSRLELSFIGEHLGNPRRCLDIGCGNGRIIEFLSSYIAQGTDIVGIDMAASMVNFCKRKFAHDTKVKGLKVCDLSQEDVPFQPPFDLITCIRVLKYNKNWTDIIRKVHDHLDSGGLFIFEMANKYSINRFAPRAFQRYYISYRELEAILVSQGFKDIEMTGFTKIPDVAYDFSNSDILAALVLLGERGLRQVMGDRPLARFIFVKCVKR